MPTLSKNLVKQLTTALSVHGGQKEIHLATKINKKTIKETAKRGWAIPRVVQGLEEYFNPTSQKKQRSIISLVCESYQIEEKDIGIRANSDARMVAAYLLITEGGKTHAAAAEILSYKDHTGITRAVESVSNRIDLEIELRRKILHIKSQMH